MSDGVTISFDDKELLKTLDTLAKSLPPEDVEPLLLKGAKTLQVVAKANAPHGKTGNLVKGIKVKQLDKIGSNPRSAMVKSGAKHNYIVEYGTKPRYQKKTGRFTGSMPAHPYFRPAVDAYKDDVIRALIVDLSALIDQAIK